VYSWPAPLEGASVITVSLNKRGRWGLLKNLESVKRERELSPRDKVPQYHDTPKGTYVCWGERPLPRPRDNRPAFLHKISMGTAHGTRHTTHDTRHTTRVRLHPQNLNTGLTNRTEHGGAESGRGDGGAARERLDIPGRRARRRGRAVAVLLHAEQAQRGITQRRRRLGLHRRAERGGQARLRHVSS